MCMYKNTCMINTLIIRNGEQKNIEKSEIQYYLYL